MFAIAYVTRRPCVPVPLLTRKAVSPKDSTVYCHAPSSYPILRDTDLDKFSFCTLDIYNNLSNASSKNHSGEYLSLENVATSNQSPHELPHVRDLNTRLSFPGTYRKFSLAILTKLLPSSPGANEISKSSMILDIVVRRFINANGLPMQP